MDSISDYVDGICGHNRSDGQCNDEGVLGLSRNMQPKGVMRRCHLLPRRSKEPATTNARTMTNALP